MNAIPVRENAGVLRGLRKHGLFLDDDGARPAHHSLCSMTQADLDKKFHQEKWRYSSSQQESQRLDILQKYAGMTAH